MTNGGRDVRESFQSILPSEKDPFSNDVIRLLEKGLMANERTNDFQVNTLSSLLMSFLAVEHSIGNWFEKHLQLRNINILETIRNTREDLSNFPNAQTIRNLTFSSIETANTNQKPLRNYLRSCSVTIESVFLNTRNLIQLQQKFLNRNSTVQQQPTQVGSMDIKIELHHIMATLIFYPPSTDPSNPFQNKHITKLLFPKIDESNFTNEYRTLMNSFLTFIEDKYTEHFAFYLEVAEKNYLSNYEADGQIREYFESVKTKLIDDKATADDKFSYHPYAVAIGLFLMDKQTKPPLTLSIQAPWGFGKSSMIEQLVQYLLPISSLTYTQNPLKKDQEKGEISQFDMTKNVLNSLTENEKLNQLKNSFSTFSRPQPLVIRFNAWKYENTDQIWAGLMDTILDTLTHLIEKDELVRFFWLQLHLRRKSIKPLQDEIEHLEIERKKEIFEQLRKRAQKYTSVLISGLAIITIIIAGSVGTKISTQLSVILAELLVFSIGGLISYYKIKDKKKIDFPDALIFHLIFENPFSISQFMFVLGDHILPIEFVDKLYKNCLC